jgi:hypothetical protein
MEDISFETVDQKVQYLLDAVGIHYDLLTVLDKIIEDSEQQSNREYYATLEQFEKEYMPQALN